MDISPFHTEDLMCLSLPSLIRRYDLKHRQLSIYRGLFHLPGLFQDPISSLRQNDLLWHVGLFSRQYSGSVQANSHTTFRQSDFCVKGASEDDLLYQVDVKLPSRAARFPLFQLARPAFGQWGVIVQRPTIADNGAPLPLRTRWVATSCRLWTWLLWRPCLRFWHLPWREGKGIYIYICLPVLPKSILSQGLVTYLHRLLLFSRLLLLLCHQRRGLGCWLCPPFCMAAFSAGLLGLTMGPLFLPGRAQGVDRFLFTLLSVEKRKH